MTQPNHPAALADLIQRLEKATGPSRELDRSIGEFLKVWHPMDDLPALAYSASLDAKLPDEDDGYWRIEGPYAGKWVAIFTPASSTTAAVEYKGVAATEALARRIASLRAKEQQP